MERCYPQSGMALDFSIEDILTVTNEVAAAGGGSSGR
jgi:hypothetical protein